MATFKSVRESETNMMVYARYGSALKLIGRVINGMPDEQLLSSPEYHEWIGGSSDGLEAEKNKRNLLIDLRTRQIIDRGFSYNGKIFSLSLEAQQNWHRLGLLAQLSSSLSGAGDLFENGYECNTLDGAAHIFEDAQSSLDFYLAMTNNINSVLKGGRDLKESVKNASSIEGVDAIEDDRII